MKALEDENSRLKCLLTDAILDNAELKEIVGKSGSACRETAGGLTHLGGSGPE
ncbi:hypothetical protein GCM10007870_29740 [Gluconobacter kondonii]|uniref:Transposase n=1 Tax=Gluconobacter kondonii TaxID=941463 RepID=A0ABQ5WWL8_9PROT|nr:hypothetical protein AA3266_2045 [Gluconobacter kondonii NBRC 3266]GLQ67389.1 hypothetical protein GCM10007870_29740 [Gluconobacter kondonii]